MKKRGCSLAVWVCIFLLTTSLSVAQTPRGGKEAGMKEIREPILAGSWYPGKPEVLSQDIRRYLDTAKKEQVDGEILALVSPHAGYICSGPVAAHAYRLIEENLEAVVVVAPSHHALSEGLPFILKGLSHTSGCDPIDAELCRRLMEKRKRSNSFPTLTPGALVGDSASVPPSGPRSFKLIPIVMEPTGVGRLPIPGLGIAETVRGKNVLLIASSDLSIFIRMTRRLSSTKLS
jgi:predicted class III extradiol MEMO1 family dioxygenase